MSTPFEAPETEAAPEDSPVHGTTRFTVRMMDSLRWIRVFHVVFGLMGMGFAVLCLVCSGAMALPVVAGAANPAGPPVPWGFLGAMVAVYVVIAVAYGLMSWFLLASGWQLQLASTTTDATVPVEAALRNVVRLWATFALFTALVVIGYAALFAVIVMVGPMIPPQPPP